MAASGSSITRRAEDVVRGDMTFDFTLRPGRALDGNALAILAQAGIPVPDSTTVEQHT